MFERVYLVMISLVVKNSFIKGEKSLIDIANEVLAHTGYDVIFIGKENSLVSEPKIKFIDASKYGVKNLEQLYSFICGLCTILCKQSFVIVDCEPYMDMSAYLDSETFIHNVNRLSSDIGIKFAVSFDV